MNKIFLMLLIACIPALTSSQNKAVFDQFLSTIPEFKYPLDTRDFEHLLEKDGEEDEYTYSINEDKLKDYTIYKSHSFGIGSLNEKFDFDTDGLAFKIPLAYKHNPNYTVVVFLYDEYKDFDNICIGVVLYTRDGLLLYEDENKSLIQCQSASYMDEDYARFYSILKDTQTIIHYGDGTYGPYKSKCVISLEGVEFQELNVE